MDSPDNGRLHHIPAERARICRSPWRVVPQFVERVWGAPRGSAELSLLYLPAPDQPQRIGEVWLTGSDNRVAGGLHAGKTLQQVASECGAYLLGEGFPAHPSGQPVFPLLVKFLFTTDKLSVQVHPPDSAAKAQGSWGKTEMWHILWAAPGARLAVGFREDAARQVEAHPAMLREAAASGAIEEMLDWRQVRAGETYFVPAGTVHAIGAGITLCEIQQNSDLTYRLYDYNRPGMDGKPRPLHLEEALAVIEPRSTGGLTTPVGWPGRPGRTLLAACPYFATERWEVSALPRTEQQDLCFAQQERGERRRLELWIALEGGAEFASDGCREMVRAGEVLVIPAAAETFSLRPAGRGAFLRTCLPDWEHGLLASLRAAGLEAEDLKHTVFPLGTTAPEAA
ncbi:MAG TPA: type I phosphomannose isomerase catalytic subunit [Terriglobia bacterium]|nr:type I phosphomannose isomerase catalytic subunit [Terriglobia bacterium]